MATTSPDNIRTPNPNDNFNLIADWATTASDVQAALVKRANMYVGTSAQRAAFTSAPEGTHWQDTNGDKLEWVRQGGAWVEVRLKLTTVSGTHTFTSIPANGAASAPITFSTPFQTVHSVSTWSVTSNNQLGSGVRALTNSGFQLVGRSHYGAAISPAEVAYIVTGTVA